MKKINLFLGIAELLVAAALTLGSLFVFNACPGEDGKYMACHWAQNAVVLIGSLHFPMTSAAFIARIGRAHIAQKRKTN